MNSASALHCSDERLCTLKKIINQLKIIMKATSIKVAEKSQPPVFPQILHERRPDSAATDPASKPQKRDRIFSKSRDVRENRGTRELKTKNNPQTLFRKSALL
jgi:hypothetical protein